MEKKIIILEDDRDIREICSYLFSSEGFEVNSYGTVSSFIKSTIVPDIYLLDIRLPDGNGLEVCRELKADPLYQKVPIIMMSAHLDARSVREHCDAEAFIAKPFMLDDLLKRAELLISKAKLL